MSRIIESEVQRHQGITASPSTRRYKASLAKASPAATRAELTAQRKCFLAISLASKNSEGGRLESCLAWIGETFEECMILVCDSFYRHTLQVVEQTPPSEAPALAQAHARQFVLAHQEMIEAFSGRCRFCLRMSSEVTASSGFIPYHTELRQLYQENRRFQESVSGFADFYLARGDKGIEKGDEGLFKRIAVAYLLEEAAVFCCLVDAGWPVLVYPGGIKTFQEISEGRHPEAPASLRQLHLVALRLKSRGRQHAST